MSTILKDPKSLEDELVRMLAGFSQMHLPSVMDEVNRWHPPIDVMEIDDKFIIIAEIAGISTSDVSISQTDDIIIIRGNRHENLTHSSPMFHHMEINYGPFERNIKLPARFIGGNVSASYKNGFLKIEISPNNTTGRTISID